MLGAGVAEAHAALARSVVGSAEDGEPRRGAIAVSDKAPAGYLVSRTLSRGFPIAQRPRTGAERAGGDGGERRNRGRRSIRCDRPADDARCRRLPARRARRRRRRETAAIRRAGRPPATSPAIPRASRWASPPHATPPTHPALEDELNLMPGATIADGRYRLLVFHGGPDHLQFWQALDTALDRQVALTFVDPDGQLPADAVQDILSRTLRLSRINMPGIARVLDVARTPTGGLIVSEWIRGGSLQEVAVHLSVADRRRPRDPGTRGGRRCRAPCGRCTVDRSPEPDPGQHRRRRGARFSRDHARRHSRRRPSRYRCRVCTHCWSTGGHCRKAASPAGWTPRARDPAGNPVEPKAVAREIPFQISAQPRRARSGEWRNNKRRNAFESPAAGHRGSRSHRADRAGRGSLRLRHLRRGSEPPGSAAGPIWTKRSVRGDARGFSSDCPSEARSWWWRFWFSHGRSTACSPMWAAAPSTRPRSAPIHPLRGHP